MICEACKLAADRSETEGWRHGDCYNKTEFSSDGVIKAREEEIKGCDCQHHPVGTRQIKKVAK